VSRLSARLDPQENTLSIADARADQDAQEHIVALGGAPVLGQQRRQPVEQAVDRLAVQFLAHPAPVWRQVGLQLGRQGHIMIALHDLIPGRFAGEDGAQAAHLAVDRFLGRIGAAAAIRDRLQMLLDLSAKVAQQLGDNGRIA